MKIEMEKREKVHHLVFKVRFVPRITQPPRRRTHRRTPHARDTGTPPRRAHGKDTGERTGERTGTETRESHGTPPTTHEDGAHGLCDGAVASWCGEHGERVVEDLGAFCWYTFERCKHITYWF